MFKVDYYRLHAKVSDMRIFGTMDEVVEWINLQATIEPIIIRHIERS